MLVLYQEKKTIHKTEHNMPNSVIDTARFYGNIPNAARLIQAIKTKKAGNLPEERIPLCGLDADAISQRLDFLQKKNINLPRLTGQEKQKCYEGLEGNIENFIGMSTVPTGVIGPLNILGSEANGDFFVPLATGEGALVASYDRGARVTRAAGGITSICLSEAVQRSPVFRFENLADLGLFVSYTLSRYEKFAAIVAQHSRYAQLTDMKTIIEGNQLILTFEYRTGDAAGQNMVTICTDALCRYLVESSPVVIRDWYVEGNYSGDKKATASSLANVRGKKVTAETELPRTIVERMLHTTPEKMAQYWQTSTIGVIQSGAIGAQGHVANGLAAMFIACGQDVACIAEASVGITRMELTKTGLYVSVTLPNLIVGTVGGSTGLFTQSECLKMMDCQGEGKARKFAEICGALAIAGEISIAAALSAGHFTSAHKKLGRKKK